MPFKERTLTCQDCGKPFVFTVEEQHFHAQKGYTHDPKRCPDCRRARREGPPYRGGRAYERPTREMYPVTCAQCGARTEVPFQPRGDKPVYCSDCYSKRPARLRR
ncbi:MAG TPA: zinc-ribbon domain containing protein [Dehalococcoidia bacterium]|nr:zinc-ribbon domain containing protein [Dehalococcoidia bacterium]